MVTALAGSDDELAHRAVLRALKHRDRIVRYGAASGLVRKHDRASRDALLDSLRDRSSDVQFTIVQAMQRRADLRDVRAVPALESIVASRKLQKHSPGLCMAAQEVIRQIETEAARKP